MSADGPVGGNALDQALYGAAAAEPLLRDLTGCRRVGELPFDHERQLATVLVRAGDGATTLVTKGAPEAVLARCVDSPKESAAVLEGLFADGARVVAIATREAAESGGVSVKVITGDNGTVAVKVCRDIGVYVEAVLTGAQLDELDDDALIAAIPHTTVFASVSPDQKSRIIKLARSGGADVAFPGDGVNDAVALHAADIVLLDKDPRRARRRRHGRTTDLREHPQVRAPGDVVELREHVQRRGRVAVPLLPADAAPRALLPQPPEPDDDRPADRVCHGRRNPSFTPLAEVLGFASLPLAFFLILLAMIAGYLVLAEAVKARFCKLQDRPRGPRTTRAARHHGQLRGRAARFAGHRPAHRGRLAFIERVGV